MQDLLLLLLLLWKRGELHSHFGEVLSDKALGVVAMRRAVVSHKIVSQLVTQNHPPVHNRISPIGIRALKKSLFLQLLEVEVIAEDAARSVESDSLAAGIIEDAQARGKHREDRAAIQKDRCEQFDTISVIR